MASRREFLKVTGAAVTAAATTPLFGWQGANNRLRMGVIGCGTRAARVFDSLTRNPDCEFTVGCEVNPAKLTNFQANRPYAQKLQMVGDYRRVLDRNDIDAVLIATPDFSHSKIAVDAMAAGKDVYVEKPVANSVPRINAMLDAYNKSNRVVQVGTHQRSWDHFIDAKKILDSGVLGSVTQVIISQPGSYARPKENAQPLPDGLDWNLWQMVGLDPHVEKRDFKPTRLGFRAWYQYGSGMIGDWGAHHVDVGNWFMNADHKAPIKTAAVGSFIAVPDADPEMVQDTFSISWLYDTHTMTFTNAVMARPNETDIEGWGVFFVSGRGSLQVNRMGWALRPAVPTTIRKQGALPPPGAGNVNMGAAPAPAAAGAPGTGARGAGRGGRAAGAPGAAPAGPGGPAGPGPGGRGAGNANLPPIELKVYVNPKGGVEEDYPLDVHTRNFLDCVKARNKKTNAPMEIGYNSALPCLLALESLQSGKMLTWDAAERKSKPV